MPAGCGACGQTKTAMTNVQVWSCGGGTQSGAIATLIGLGKLPRPDYAFMTDTGRERSSTWPFVDGFIRPALASVGLELTVVKASEFARLDVYWNDTVLLPGYTNITGSVGKLSPFCSGKWKRDVAERWMLLPASFLRAITRGRFFLPNYDVYGTRLCGGGVSLDTIPRWSDNPGRCSPRRMAGRQRL